MVESADVSPDARLLATGDADGVRLWDVYAGRSWPTSSAVPSSRCFSTPMANI